MSEVPSTSTRAASFDSNDTEDVHQTLRIDSDSDSEETEDEDADEEAGRSSISGFSRIVELYTKLWSKMMSPSGINGLDMNEFAIILPELRGYFICAVCSKLLSSNFVITSVPEVECPLMHPICEACQRKDLKHLCTKHSSSSYLDSNGFEFNYYKLLLDSYKGFCSLFIQTQECRMMLELKAEVDPTFDALTLLNFLTDGALGTLNSNDTSPKPHGQSSPKERTKRPIIRNTTVKLDDSANESDSDGHSQNNGVILFTNSTVEKKNFKTISPGTKNSNSLQLFQSLEGSTRKWPDPNTVIQYASGNMGMLDPNCSSSSLQLSHSTDTESTSPTLSPESGIVGCVVRAVAGVEKKLKVRLPKKDVPQLDTPSNLPSKIPRKGCRCGNATAIPGKLTCCGQRCPCYVERKLCVDCRCKGCRNPHLADGKKLLPGGGQIIEVKPSVTNSIISSTVSNTNTLTFQAIPEVSQTFASPYILNPVASYTGYSMPVQVPISLVGISSLIQPNVPTFSMNKY